MARQKTKNENENVFDTKTSKKGIEMIGTLMDQLSTNIYGTQVSDETIDNLNDRFNNVMRNHLNQLGNSGTHDMNSFLGQLYVDDRDSRRSLQSIGEKFDIGGNNMAVNPSDFITDQYRNRLLKQADAHNISNQLIELCEAKNTMRDAIVSPDINTGRINRNITFDHTTANDAEKDYMPVIEAIEKKYDLPNKIKNFIVDQTLSYGEYYAYTIPYKDIFQNFTRKYKNGKNVRGGRYFESVDSSTVEDVRIESLSFMESAESHYDKEFVESVTRDMVRELDCDPAIDKDIVEGLTHDVDSLLTDRITLSLSPIPIPIVENGFDCYRDIGEKFINNDANFSESYDFFEAGKTKKSGKVMGTDEDVYFRKYGGNMSDDGFHQEAKKEKNEYEEINDCYFKLIPPTRLIPVDIMGTTIFYLYIQTEDATPLSAILSYSTQLKTKDPSNRVNRLVDDVALRIVNRFDAPFVKENQEFRKLIISALQYYELGNQKIHFQIVPKEYITEFKINKDLDGVGHSMLEPSLFYAKLYLMIFMFKIITILTKSNDTTINYIRTSGIDKNSFNKAQEIAREKQGRRITLNDMFSYTNVVNKVAAGSEIFMPLTKSGEKPIETDILQGQSVELNNDFMEGIRKNYILATGVPSAILNYLDEADFAKSIENANTKMNGRIINYQIDINDGLTKLYQKLLKYSTSVPDTIIDSITVTLPSPKGNSNLTSQELINNYQTMQDFLLKMYFGDNMDDEELTKSFSKELAKLHLPMINFAQIDDIFEKCKIKAEGRKLTASSDDDLGDM